MTGFLPADGATTRLHKLNHLIEHCAAFGVKGCTEAQLLKEGQLQGNTTSKVLEYITLLVTWGLITRTAERYYVNELNYIDWAEAKGYRERIYWFKCTNPDCPASYASKTPLCPSCQTPNPLILNEPQDYTHTIPIKSIPLNQKPHEKTTDQDTHIHTETPPLRKNRVKAGKEAEKRVVKFLSKYGRAWLGSGANGSPDVFFNSSRGSYGVEVKSVEHQVRVGVDRFKASSVPLSVDQWRRLCVFAEGNRLVPLLVVEVRVRGSKNGSIIHFIPREVVDDRVSRFGGKHLRFSVLDLGAMSVQTVRVGLPIIGGFRL